MFGTEYMVRDSVSATLSSGNNYYLNFEVPTSTIMYIKKAGFYVRPNSTNISGNASFGIFNVTTQGVNNFSTSTPTPLGGHNLAAQTTVTRSFLISDATLGSLIVRPPNSIHLGTFRSDTYQIEWSAQSSDEYIVVKPSTIIEFNVDQKNVVGGSLYPAGYWVVFGEISA